MSRSSAWLLAIGILVFPVLLTAQESKLPPGKGRELLTSVCQQCHGIEGALTQRHTEEDWKDLIYSMVSNGAPLLDDEVDTLASYMGKNFGPEDKQSTAEAKPAGEDAAKATAKININTTTSKELQTILELSEKEADAVVSYREKHGKIADLADLKKVEGLDSQKIDATKDRLEF